MAPLLLDGKKVRDEIKVALAREVATFAGKPKLAIIQVGTNKESNAYIAQKKKFGMDIGISVEHLVFAEGISQASLLSQIRELNDDRGIHGMIVQLPLPAHIDTHRVLEEIAPGKDVDGLHSTNMKFLLEGKTGGFVPATARGVISLLQYYQIPITGVRVAVLGRSILVGKPITLLLLNYGATVTVCHSQSVDVEKITKASEIVIVAIGKPKLIGKNYFSKDQVIIDVGINSVEGQKLDDEIPARKIVGDVDFDAASKKAKAITPVPGGVGPMTVASLFQNVVLAYRVQNAR
ncbi:MAG: bifunctional 5,10-methylene-tetrahydrofolate dehydrogenase / 5,10-methylene-tetrahydrofolate [Candidatus Parcubacteria bacterium]|jgi:5,10-methylene-tetrahydrofolate dehydrogenase/methenyl tetrahydrofolate cyclohydrolase